MADIPLRDTVPLEAIQLKEDLTYEEKPVKILEDMLRACALDYGSNWDDNLPYVELSYNNSYQASLNMAPFEALYGRRCRTPLSWDQVGDRQLFRPDLIRDSEEKVKLIRDRLKVA